MNMLISTQTSKLLRVRTEIYTYVNIYTKYVYVYIYIYIYIFNSYIYIHMCVYTDMYMYVHSLYSQRVHSVLGLAAAGPLPAPHCSRGGFGHGNAESLRRDGSGCSTSVSTGSSLKGKLLVPFKRDVGFLLGNLGSFKRGGGLNKKEVKT